MSLIRLAAAMSGKGGGAPGLIFSDDLSDNPAQPIFGTVRQPNPGGGVGAQWSHHAGSSGGAADMTADAVAAPGAFLMTTQLGSVWYSQEGPTDSLVVETELVNNAIDTTTFAGICFCVDPSTYNDQYIINHGGTGGGGTRVSQMNGTSTVNRITALDIQGVTGGRLRVQLNYTTWLCQFWTDYLVYSGTDTGSPYYGETTITAKAGRHVGIYSGGGVLEAKRFSYYQYGQGF